MRIACPSCAAEYEVPEARLGVRKTVRCSRCGGEWVVSPPADAAPVEPDPVQTRDIHEEVAAAALPELTAMDQLAAAPAVPVRDRRLTAAWILTGIVLIIGFGAVLLWRDAVVHAWPPSSRLLGMPEQGPRHVGHFDGEAAGH